MKNWKYYLYELVLPVLGGMFLIAWLIFRPVFLVDVPTGSMESTIMPGDRIVVTKFLLGVENNVNRGDIVVFQSDELKKMLIKRLIGLPKDEIEITADGELMVNGQKVKEPYVVNNRIGSPQKFKVPEGKYLFLGDNRTNSHDARYWQDKYIPAQKLEAKAQFVIFPFNRIQWMK